MTHRALLLAVASCFAAAGCSDKAAEPPKPKTTPAAVVTPKAPEATQVVQTAGTRKKTPRGLHGCTDENRCRVHIKVSGTPPNCVFDVDPKDLPVAKKASPVVISWRIHGSDFVFGDDGIVFKEPPGDQFTDKGGEGTDKYKWKDKNDNDDVYDYTVNVKRKRDGAKCNPHDPTVMNGAEDPTTPAIPLPDPPPISGRPAPAGDKK